MLQYYRIISVLLALCYTGTARIYSKPNLKAFPVLFRDYVVGNLSETGREVFFAVGVHPACVEKKGQCIPRRKCKGRAMYITRVCYSFDLVCCYDSSLGRSVVGPALPTDSGEVNQNPKALTVNADNGQKSPEEIGNADNGQKPSVEIGNADKGQKPPVQTDNTDDGQKPPVLSENADDGLKSPVPSENADDGQKSPVPSENADDGQKPPVDADKGDDATRHGRNRARLYQQTKALSAKSHRRGGGKDKRKWSRGNGRVNYYYLSFIP